MHCLSNSSNNHDQNFKQALKDFADIVFYSDVDTQRMQRKRAADVLFSKYDSLLCIM